MHLRYPEGLQSTVDRRPESARSGHGAPSSSGTVDVLRASYALRIQPEKGYFSFLAGRRATPAA